MLSLNLLIVLSDPSSKLFGGLDLMNKHSQVSDPGTLAPLVIILAFHIQPNIHGLKHLVFYTFILVSGDLRQDVHMDCDKN